MVPLLGPEELSLSGIAEVGMKEMQSVGLVLVKARLEEISLRTINAFELYDTMSK